MNQIVVPIGVELVKVGRITDLVVFMIDTRYYPRSCP